MAELSPKQQVFVNEYLKCWNATEAARIAGYKHPNVQGPRLLVNVRIAAEISRRITESAMSANESVIAMSEIARASMADFVSVHGGVPVIDFEKAEKAQKLGLVKKIKYGRGTISFELYDKQRAVETIMRHHGLLKDGITININIELVTQTWIELQEAGIDPAETFQELINLARNRRTNPGSDSVPESHNPAANTQDAT